MRIWLLVSLSLLGLAACENPAPAEPRADKLAKSLCQCTSELLILNKKAESTQDSLVFQQIAQSFEKSKACAQALGIKPEDQPALETALKAFCPELIVYPEMLQELLAQ
ncbi:MAG TPA: hypothetical protein VK168_08145 [Saprospiraceae bacterium]|nr:hypothetical protein [Saprospiraceae bacterium]